MQPGDGFTRSQRSLLAQSVESADRSTGLSFQLVVGSLEGGRAGAEALLAARGASATDTVIVAVDPVARSLEIVTGVRASRRIDDRTCALAALAMTSSFSAGDLVGGIRNGLQVLSDHGRNSVPRHIATT